MVVDSANMSLLDRQNVGDNFVEFADSCSMVRSEKRFSRRTDFAPSGMCLGLDGFGPCDVNSLWILASTNLKKKTVAFVSMLAPEADRMCLGSASGGIFSSRRPVGVSK